MSQEKTPQDTASNKYEIANLIATIVLGLLTIGVGLWVAYLNNQTKTSVVELEAQLAREATLAQLEIVSICADYSINPDCADGIQVTNLGPATAENTRIAIVIDRISPSWQAVISDVQDFRIITNPPALGVSIEESRTEVQGNTLPSPAHNELVLSLDALPPNVHLQVLPILQPYISLDKYDVIRPAIIQTQDMELSRSTIEDTVRDHLREKFFIARFTASSSCDNCQGSIDQPHVLLSSLDEEGYEHVSLALSQYPTEWRFLLRTIHNFPQSEEFTPDISRIYLTVDRDSSSGQLFAQEFQSSDSDEDESVADLGNGLRLVSVDIQSQGTDLNASFTATVPYIVGLKNDAADKFNQKIQSFVDKERADFRIEQDRIYDSTEGETVSYLKLNHEVANSSGRVISILFHSEAYFEGAAPSSQHSSITYDMPSSEFLNLDDLFKDGSNYLDIISAYSIGQLREREGLYRWFERNASPDAENYDLWNISPSGLRITFEEYQVAPGSAGPQIVIVPYDTLIDILDTGGPIGPLIE